MRQTDRGRKALVTNDAAMFLYGLSAVLIGPAMPGMIADFGLSHGGAGLIGSVQSAGGFVGAIVALWLADRYSRSAMMLVSFALVGASLLAIGGAASYTMLLAAFALSGFFVRLLDVMLNAHTGALVHGDSGKGMSALHMFFSIGAFLGPVAARALMRAGLTWADVFLVVGASYFAALALSARWLREYVRTGRVAQVSGGAVAASPAPALAKAAHDSDASGTASGSPRLLIGVLGTILLFYAIHQIGVTAWLPYYLEAARGADPDVASMGLSLYWIGIIAGRFLASRSARRLGAPSILFAGALAASVATGAAVLVTAPVLAGMLAAVAGVTSGATIPLAYSVGFTVAPTRTGAVTAVMSVIMLAGRLLGPWLIGAVADASTLPVAMMIPAVVLLAAGALAGAVVLLTRRAGPQPPASARLGGPVPR